MTRVAIIGAGGIGFDSAVYLTAPTAASLSAAQTQQQIDQFLAEWGVDAKGVADLPGGLVRQYSLYGHPGDRSRYRVAVLLEPQSRGGSRAVHALQPGLELVISAPRNAFPLAAQETKPLKITTNVIAKATTESPTILSQPVTVTTGWR